MINRAINNDTVPEVRETVLAYFESIPDAEYSDMFNMYLLNKSKGDLVSAQNNIDELRNYASSLNDIELSEEINMFCDINDLYLELISDTSTNLNILSDNTELLFEAESDNSPLYSATARVLLELCTDTVFLEYTPLPSPQISNKNVTIQDSLVIHNIAPFINVYPNPASNIVFIEYNFEEFYIEGNDLLFEQLGIHKQENCKRGELKLFTEDGKILQVIPFEDIQGIVNLNISGYSEGIYIIEITDCYGNKTSQKITKNH